jgi:hypothetical protein
MPTRTERRSMICDTCGAVATVEYTATLNDETVERVDIDARCPNEECATRT